jgi:PAS domain S-box-containing protein
MHEPPPAILVIEDDADVRRSIALWLASSGYTPLEAADGREGLERLRELQPDAVLLDLRLPGLDGFGVLAALAAEAAPPPVIVISGLGEIDGVIRAFRMGAADYLQKPIVNFDLLEHALSTVLERTRLARAVTLAQDRYFTLVQNLPLLVFVLRPDLELEFVNASCRAMLGYDRDEAMVTPGWFLDRVHPDDRARVRACLGLAAGDKPAARTEQCRLLHRNGATVHVLLTAMPPLPGQPPLTEGIAVDITDRVELERFVVQEEKLKTLGAISAEVAHEIRNPLFSIAGFAHRLKARLPDSPEADIILAEARRLEDILDRIGKYLHPVDLRPKRCALGAIVTTTLDFLAPELAARKVGVTTRLAEDLPELRLDPDVLCQVVASLARFTVSRLPEGGSAWLATSRWQGFALLRLGASLPSPIQEPELLFLPFEEGGERMGLPLARRLVKNMGGALTFEQTDDGQAVFNVRLPLDGPDTNNAGSA